MNSNSCTDKAFKSKSVALGFVELQFIKAAVSEGSVAFRLGRGDGRMVEDGMWFR